MRIGLALPQYDYSVPGERPLEFDTRTRSPTMQDVWMLLFTAVFFVLAFLYVKACQKLR